MKKNIKSEHAIFKNDIASKRAVCSFAELMGNTFS
jgi:hypothetical protein